MDQVLTKWIRRSKKVRKQKMSVLVNKKQQHGAW